MIVYGEGELIKTFILPGQALHLVVAERRPVFEHRQLVPRSGV